MSVKILADSACDLPLDFYEENGAILFPLKVHIDGTEYEDLRTIQPKQVYDAIRAGNLPKTSQASPAGFKEVFTEMAENKQEGIYIAFSSELSGTYQTAVMISEQVKEEYPDFNLSVIDTKCASLGQGLVVMEAVRMAKENYSKEEIVKAVQFHSEHMEHLFSVDDLDHLAKGGRVSKASAFVGGLLNIKPLLNVEDGKLVPLEKIRGKKKLLRRIIEVMKERGVAFEEQVVGISHADDLETATEMKNMIIEELHAKDVYITSIGAAVGSHTGPGTIAIFFLNKQPS
ncbi:DegV family protein [Mesobacillus sp. AQ2]|jgi:DegV family protein with EDD domain|uniref:DegV family protein n=1 Tax=Bacillaceae TaxID=186817 RepID=UPI00119DBF7C|nr:MULTISPECIES: DegV family protein [Bacillaceae]MCM3124898.1 DegV family protein [Mesobacillus sp. MER 33]MCM3232793.1 DegV family protein [Mesobacillus sp. MER 48]WHX41882.1 DegV family protein [Mesobacillus sp. AQ2]